MLNTETEIFCEWGAGGITKLSPHVDIFIIVDVLSFSTCVDAAVSNGAFIIPFPHKDERAAEFARENNAELASIKRSKTEYSLSPSSLVSIKPGLRLVLPSPNGSELSLASDKITLTACLRNCRAVAEYVNTLGKNIGVIPAGEKRKDDAIRLAMEDYIGAGAVISFLNGRRSESAEDAELSFKGFRRNLYDTVRKSVSGIELAEMGFPEDVKFACELDAGRSVPLLQEGVYSDVAIGGSFIKPEVISSGLF